MWSEGRAGRGFCNTARAPLARGIAALGPIAFTLALLAKPSVARAQAHDPEQRVAAPLTAASTAGAEGWSRRLARSHLQRAVTLEQRDDIAGALREYTQCIAIDSTLGEAYSRLGALRERMGDAREAELVYSEAVRLGDSRAQALLQRSHLQRAAGRSALALSDLEASVELDPNREALTELAADYVQLHAFAAALFTVRRVIAITRQSGDNAALQAQELELRALRVLAAEMDPTSARVRKHDWVGRSLASIARR